MPPKQPTTGERVAGLQVMIEALSVSTGKSIEDLSAEMGDARQDIAHVMTMGGDIARLTGAVEGMAGDVKNITQKQIELNTEFKTELKHLARTADVTGAISTHKETCHKGHRRSDSRAPAKTNAKMLSLLVGAIVVLAGAVGAVVKFFAG